MLKMNFLLVCYTKFNRRFQSVKGYKIDHFLNLGTPEDLKDFTKWEKL